MQTKGIHDVAESASTSASSLGAKLSSSNEAVWLRMGALAELMNDFDKALYCYDNALRHNPYNLKALTQITSICRAREQYPKAVEYFQRILGIESNNGEVWGALGHCYLMMDDLQKAYAAYQQALYHLPNPKDPNLWYGIGILYDRYGSFEHAEEAFTAVLKMEPDFEKANEIYFRLGIIYKQQQKHEQSLECFRYIVNNPPRPLVQGDVYFQIGHVYELQKDFHAAKDAYERVLKENPNHAKALQQLGWLYHHNSAFGDQDVAIGFLMRSIDADLSDGQTWYLLGRCYMAQQKYRKAYDAYQQAVYRDGRNPTFWCSIGVLYYQINQYRDALDAYSRAIRLNPYLSEVWYDLGTLYESCNQISDSLDAYQRAAELDPSNKHIQQRLNMLRGQLNGDSKGKGPQNIARDAGVAPKKRNEARGNNAKPTKRKQKQKQKQKQSPESLSPKTSSTNGNGSTSIPSFSQLTANENEKKNGSEDAEMSDSSSERKSAHKNGHFREPREDSPEGDNSTNLPAQGLAALKQVIDDEREEEESSSSRPPKKRDRMETEEGDLEIHEKDDEEDTCNDK